MIKGAIIGLGKMGLSHAAIIGANPLVQLQAVCDSSTLILNAFKKYTDVTVYSDYNEMFDKEELDFVIIATPTRLHYKMVKDAIKKNLHVFCEKPLSMNLDEGEELSALIKNCALTNQVGYHNHFIGTFRELRRLLKEEVLGELIHFTGEAYGPVVIREKGSTWRSKATEGGGCTMDYASHVVNLIQEIIGRPVKINGTLLKSIYSKDVDDAVYSFVTLENGLSGVLLVNWSDETYRKMTTRLTVMGKKGKIICDATEMQIYLKEPNSKEKLEKGWTIRHITDFAIPVNFYLRGEEYSAELEYFINNIINKKEGVYNTFEQAYYTDRVMKMIVAGTEQN